MDSPEELEELIKNDTAFELFFNSLERVQSMKTVREELRSGNENLARKCVMVFKFIIMDDYTILFRLDKNLAKEDELMKLRSQVKDLNEKYIELRTKFEEKERQQQEAFSVSCHIASAYGRLTILHIISCNILYTAFFISYCPYSSQSQRIRIR